MGMRRLLLCGLLGALIAWMQQAPALALDPADGPGCLGVPAETCVRWLRATMVLNESFLVEAMARRHQVDVNGKPLNDGFVTIYARLPNRVDQFVILLYLRPDDTVARVRSNILHTLRDAVTEPAYDESALYDMVWRLLGRRCPSLVKLDLYRFFENVVKPRITEQREDFSGGLHSLHRLTAHAAGLPYCGITFSYTSQLEWRGAKDIRAAQKVTSISHFELQ
jgi:hypothetical protein